jgi:hypothetical protein
MSGYICLVELTDENSRLQELMTLLTPQVTPEIIHLDHGFVDGIVLLTGGDPSFCSAILFFQCKAVSFWVSRDDGGNDTQN